MSLADNFRAQADFFDREDVPLYAILLRGMADDYDHADPSGGVVRRICAGWEQAPGGAVVQLRLLGALHAVVLTRRAPELATYYRSVGGQAEPSTAWPVAHQVLIEHEGEIAAALAQPPQTNDPGRSTALAVGLLAACAAAGCSRVRLLEVGASAGLNLLVDRFRIGGVDWSWGPSDSPVDLTGAVSGALDESSRAMLGGVSIVARRGCDLEPVDPVSAQGRLRLTSFVWPDHVERFRRLAGALQVAATTGAAPVDRAPATPWLQRQLSEGAGDGVLTVVWHSIFRQYLTPQEQHELDDVISAARRRMPIAHLALESPSVPYLSPPQLSVDGRVLATSKAHGVPLHLNGT